MSTRIPSLIGPIQTGASFMIASIQNNTPYILNGFPFGNGILYYWESNLNTLLASTHMGVFTAQGTLDALTITDTINNGGIAFRADGITVGNATQPTALKMEQNIYANWHPPDVFLSAVVYTMSNNSGATADILTTTSATGPTIPANNIIILPVLWYFNCTNSGTYDYINQPLDSITNWICLVTPRNAGCTGINIAPSGWTNLPDCTVGNFYSYCLSGQVCGFDNCKGPCSATYDDCNFSSGTYVCKFNPEEYVANTPWYLSPIFIGSVIGITIIIILIFVIIFAVERHGKKTGNPPSGKYDSYSVN